MSYAPRFVLLVGFLYLLLPLYSYRLYSYGLYSYRLYRLYRYRLYNYDLCSYGLYSYGLSSFSDSSNSSPYHCIVMAYIVMAYIVLLSDIVGCLSDIVMVRAVRRRHAPKIEVAIGYRRVRAVRRRLRPPPPARSRTASETASSGC